MASQGYLLSSLPLPCPYLFPRLWRGPTASADREQDGRCPKEKIRKEESVKHEHRIMGFMNT
jgi:hypothetical protein